MIEGLPDYVWLTTVGAAGGFAKYVLPEKVERNGHTVSEEVGRGKLLCSVLLGAIIGNAGSQLAAQLIAPHVGEVGLPGKCLLALFLGGAGIALFSMGVRLTAKAGDYGASQAEKKYLPPTDEPKKGE